VQTYSDAGRSGLRIDNRKALKQLLSDVSAGATPFEAILVYDVSRWGRFQDTDEAAYYEYACKRAGIAVHYCAEQFDNDGTPLATIIKGLKRAMAAEYSRELGVKVYAGQKRVVEQGFRLGALAGFGLRRQIVDLSGKPKHVLEIGERKAIQTDRIVLVPGPDNEVRVVREIFRAFVRSRSEKAIAASLNERGIRTDLGRCWTNHNVHQILTNPKYIGRNVWNRVSFRLKKSRVKNPASAWIEGPTRFTPIVDRRTFNRAADIIARRKQAAPDEELLAGLRALRKKHGKVTARLIDAAKKLPSAAVYYRRFGGLAGAYRRIGFKPKMNLAFSDLSQALRRLRSDIVVKVQAMLETRGDRVRPKRAGRNTALIVNDRVTVHFLVMKCWMTRFGYPRWRIGCLHRSAAPGAVVAIRMDEQNAAPAALYFYKQAQLIQPNPNIRETDLKLLEPFRISGLDMLYGLVEGAGLKGELSH
jgi:DNA invertase Pin-like site-specific DNA recombinase